MKISPLKRLSLQLVIEKEFVRLIMPVVTATGWKVLTFMILESDAAGGKPVSLTYNQIMTGTGIGGKATISKALKNLADQELLITIRPDDPTISNQYRLNQDFTIEVTDPPAPDDADQRSSETEPQQQRSSETEPQKNSVSTIISIKDLDQERKKERKKEKIGIKKELEEEKHKGKRGIVKGEKGGMTENYLSLLPDSFEQTDEFKATWADWLADRKERRKPVTKIAAKKQLGLLGLFPTEVAIEMINQSIMSGWQGIFKLRPGHPVLIEHQTKEPLQDPGNIKLEPLKSA